MNKDDKIGYYWVHYDGHKYIMYFDGYEWMSPHHTYIHRGEIVIMIKKINFEATNP